MVTSFSGFDFKMAWSYYWCIAAYIKSNIHTCCFTFEDDDFHNMRLDIGKWTEMSHLAYSISLAQLIVTLTHCLCTVALTGLADWSAFLKLVLLTMWSHNWDSEAYGGHHMGGMGLIFTPALVRHLLGPLGLSRLMTSTSWTHGISKQSCWKLILYGFVKRRMQSSRLLKLLNFNRASQLYLQVPRWAK